MANRNEIYEKIMFYKNRSQDAVRHEYLADLGRYTKRDTIIYAASSVGKPGMSGDALSINNEDISGFMTALDGLKGDSLDLIIHSPGGSAEATEQIAQYLRAKYKSVRAIIPQMAMSAATMLACACDEIVMSKAAAIGPIDPQVYVVNKNGVGAMVPVQSILSDFEQAKKEISQDRTAACLWAPKFEDLPSGFLDLSNKYVELSKTMVKKWLDEYMFKGDDIKRGHEIAEWLVDSKEHDTHGRPISYQQALEKGLKVTLLEDDQKLQDKIMSVFHATMISFEVTPCVKIVENHFGRGRCTMATPVHR